LSNLTINYSHSNICLAANLKENKFNLSEGKYQEDNYFAVDVVLSETKE